MTLFNSFEDYRENNALISSKYGTIKYKDIIEFEKKLKKIIKKNTFFIIITKNALLPIIVYIFAIRNNCTVMLVDSKTDKSDILKIINIYQHNYIVLPDTEYEDPLFINNKKILSKYDYTILENISDNKIQNKFNRSISLLLPTSGSLGSPKFVILSKKNIESNTKSIISFLNITKTDRAITTMPISYTYMLSIINTHIEKGASIFVTEDSIISREFWNQYSKNMITSFSGVPYIFEILKKIGLEKIFTPFLTTITQAGGRLDQNTIKAINVICEKKDVKFITMYGQTEATARISFLDYKHLQDKVGSIGKAIPGGKIWIEDAKGKKIIQSGQQGELIYKGSNVFMGYANNISDLNNVKNENKVLRTGDIATFDKDNFFYIEGRIKRIAKIFGNRFNLDEVEQKMLEKNFKIVCKDSKEKLLIYYDQEYSEKDILMNISLITHQNKVAFKCIKLIKIPRTNSGKIDFGKLNEI